jgi:hypothetical protein
VTKFWTTLPAALRLAIQLVSLIVCSFFIIRAAEDTERRLINLLIIIGSTALGVAGTLIIEYLADEPGEFAIRVGIISAYIGCAVAQVWNYWRNGGIYKGKKGRGMKSDKTVV